MRGTANPAAPSREVAKPRSRKPRNGTKPSATPLLQRPYKSSSSLQVLVLVVAIGMQRVIGVKEKVGQAEWNGIASQGSSSALGQLL